VGTDKDLEYTLSLKPNAFSRNFPLISANRKRVVDKKR
jgi:hypothetical protein